MNRTQFYNRISTTLFSGELSQAQVTNIEALINAWEKEGGGDLRQLAYILGTVYHETARTMQPIEEFGKGAGRKYSKRVKYNGTPYVEAHIFYGRGHTQNTWWDIYNALTIAAKRAGKNWDFLNQPELLLQVEPSVWATIYAMRTGLYTGKKLSSYFNEKTCDWLNARRIINGIDCAAIIANHSKAFYQALQP